MEIKVSVRGLVEFLLRTGDIDNRKKSAPDDAMAEGSRIHRMIQKKMGSSYHAEVMLRYRRDCGEYDLVVEGRADGIIDSDPVAVDEIKGTYRDLSRMKEPNPVHLAQAKCYAWMYGQEHGKERMEVSMTYCNIETEEIRYFKFVYEMSDLEEMGYILQPHTSAGRIPSDKGYRFYVDTMLGEREREVEELKGLLLEKDEKMDTLLKRVARVLATNTNYAAMITTPQYQRNKLKFIQLSKVDEHQLLAVVVVEGNVIKNTMLQVEEDLDDATLLKLNILLNTHLNGLSIDEINLAMISAMKQQAGVHSGIVSGVIDAVAEAIRSDEDLKIYTSGTNNILKYPELTDNREKTSELINVFEEKKALGELVQDSLSEENNTGIQVYIGNETPVSSMKDCSVVTATYELGEGMRGTIGIIGPKRMDYDKVIGTLKTLMNELDTLYKK